MTRNWIERIHRAPETDGSAGGAGNGGNAGPTGTNELDAFLNQSVRLPTREDQEQVETPPKDGQEAEVVATDDQAPGNEETEESTEETPVQEGADNTQIGVEKRIGKLIAKQRQAEADIEQLRRENAELRNKPATAQEPTPDQEANPFSKTVTDGKTLSEAKRYAYDFREFCEDNPDGGTFNGKEYTGEETNRGRRAAQRALDIELPAREKQLVQQQQVFQKRDQLAQGMKQSFPDLYDRENPIGQAAEAWRNDPRLAAMPERDIAAAALAIGMAELHRRAAAAKKPANGNGNGNGQRPNTTVKSGLPPKPGAGGNRQPFNKTALAKADARLLADPRSKDAFADVLEGMGPPGFTPGTRR